MLIDPDLKTDLIESLEWMITQLKRQYDDQKAALGEESQGGYSPELTKAIETLAKLKGMGPECSECGDSKVIFGFNATPESDDVLVNCPKCSQPQTGRVSKP